AAASTRAEPAPPRQCEIDCAASPCRLPLLWVVQRQLKEVPMTEVLEGACLCGGVEYEVQDPEALGYCHCTRCQRWTGSSLAGVVVAKENFRFTKGEELVTRYESEF